MSSNEHSAVFAEPAVRVTRDGPVAVIALARQTKSNAMDGEVTVALLNTLRALGERRRPRNGAHRRRSIVQRWRGHPDDPRDGRRQGVRDAILDKHQELFWAMTRLPFPSVAAVNGAAIGAGVTVALLCDLVVMAQDAFLSDPASRSDCSTVRVELCCGRCLPVSPRQRSTYCSAIGFRAPRPIDSAWSTVSFPPKKPWRWPLSWPAGWEPFRSMRCGKHDAC